MPARSMMNWATCSSRGSDKMRYWLEPAVDGGLGPGVDYDVTREPRLVGMLAYAFDDWSGDDIVETAGYWLITDRLAEALTAHGVTGWHTEPVAVSTSDMWEQLGRTIELPPWNRLVPGTEPNDDIYVVRRVYLCVSDRALAAMRTLSLDAAEIHDVSAIPPPP